MCGIFGIYGHREAARITCLGLYALQHRGQESAGIATSDGRRLRRVVAMGLVSEAFTDDDLARLPGQAAIGHVRYSTAGGSELRNAQPLVCEYAHGTLAVVHNGNLVDAEPTRFRLEQDGSIFQTSSDTEVIVHLLARAPHGDVTARLAGALRQVTGAYSLLVLTESRMIAVRDPHGFRPLCLGRLDGGHVVSSESSSLDAIGAELVRDIEPGEMVVVDAGGVHSYRPFDSARGPAPRRMCVFEHVYFARPDSMLDGRSVYRGREQMGRQLAREHPVDADVVIPVPESGVPAAIGYARELGLEYQMGVLRSHYAGRTFIEPRDAFRHLGVRLKLSPVRAVVEGKRVVVVDDSLVRGTTSREIVKMLTGVGAREVHLRIAAPPITHPCFYGIDIPTRSELIASARAADDIARYVGCDSLAYLSHQGMLAAVGADSSGTGYCSACFTGSYPLSLGVPVADSRVPNGREPSERYH